MSVPAEDWYVARDGEQVGPISWRRLLEMTQAGELQRDQRVWRPGMDQWMPARMIPGLFTPPPVDAVPRSGRAPVPASQAPVPEPIWNGELAGRVTTDRDDPPRGAPRLNRAQVVALAASASFTGIGAVVSAGADLLKDAWPLLLLILLFGLLLVYLLRTRRSEDLVRQPRGPVPPYALIRPFILGTLLVVFYSLLHASEDLASLAPAVHPGYLCLGWGLNWLVGLPLAIVLRRHLLQRPSRWLAHLICLLNLVIIKIGLVVVGHVVFGQDAYRVWGQAMLVYWAAYGVLRFDWDDEPTTAEDEIGSAAWRARRWRAGVVTGGILTGLGAYLSLAAALAALAPGASERGAPGAAPGVIVRAGLVLAIPLIVVGLIPLAIVMGKTRRLLLVRPVRTWILAALLGPPAAALLVVLLAAWFR